MILRILAVHLWLLELCSGVEHYDKCKHFNADGVCRPLSDCHQALQEVKLNGRHSFERCGFNGFVEIVCCPLLTASIKTRKSVRVCKDYQRLVPEPQNPLAYVAFGKNVKIEEYPHVVALGFYIKEQQVYTFDCGGTLISNKYVITAAHCIANIDGNKPEVIRIGTTVVPIEPITTVVPYLDYTVKRVILHPKYNRSRSINDIALIELEREVVFRPYRRPACLYTEDEEPSEMQIAGWGSVNITGARSDILQKANVSSVPIERCISSFQSSRRSVGRTQICAQDVKSDTCAGDSGGPLQIEDNNLFTLVGITSYGYECFGGLPGVYTKVSSYLDWIEATVWP